MSITSTSRRVGPAATSQPGIGARAIDAARHWLPRGNMLRPTVWARRHRAITAIALGQSVALGIFALAIGRGSFAALIALAVPGLPAVAGLVGSMSRRTRMLSVVTSLMFASATLVDILNGLTEAHFHFFVMLGVVSLYQDWSAFGLCVAITVAHHALMGTLAPHAVYANQTEWRNPVLWAVVHGGFILAASITHMVAWRFTEQVELRDPLTQLPNREAFADELTHRLTRTQQPVAVAFLDVDNFKRINDSGGHHAGDTALQHAAAVITAQLRPDDVLARLGGDEFAIVVGGSASDAQALANRVQAALAAPIGIEGRELVITTSIGISDTALMRTREGDTLLRGSDLAMYVAKSSGRNCVVVYTEGLDENVRTRSELLADLPDATARGQLTVHYQPVMAADGARICAVEALARWEHPVHGDVSPTEFIPLAESSGDIHEIGAWVLAAACAQVAAWRTTLKGCEELTVAVNLSPVQLREPNLVASIAQAVNNAGLPTSALILEVTESTLLADLDLARRQLGALRALGIQVAIDDFGTGYSSLSYLARLPADQVKIDRSFIADLTPRTDRSIALVRVIIDLATALGLEVQAEGVEIPEQQSILTSLGCPRSQGFLFARPLTPAGFTAFVEEAADLASVLALPVAGVEQVS